MATNPNNLTDAQVKDGYSTIPGPFNPLTGAKNPNVGFTSRMDYSTSSTGTPIQVDPTTGLDVPSTNPNNPVISSTGTRAEVGAIGNDLKSYQDKAQDLGNENVKLIKDEMTAREKRVNEQIAQIKKEYEMASDAQGKRQGQDYAGRATGLVTSGGGFLGTTQSQQGVLQNLRETHETEKGALMGKRDAAIQAAQNAFDDKQFELAKSLIKEARDTEKELYDRQKDFADQSLAIAREDRAQKEYDRGVTTDKLSKYEALVANGEDVTLSSSDTKSIDAVYGQGFAQKYIDTAKKSAIAKTNKDKVALDSDVLDMRLKVPLGKKFTLGGVEYTGLKQPDKVAGEKLTVDEKKMALKQKIDTLFSPGYVIPGTDSIPILDNNKYATPEGWKAVIKISGLPRKDFIEDYGYLIPSDLIDKFGLTNPEKQLILGKI